MTHPVTTRLVPGLGLDSGLPCSVLQMLHTRQEVPVPLVVQLLGELVEVGPFVVYLICDSSVPKIAPAILPDVLGIEDRRECLLHIVDDRIEHWCVTFRIPGITQR